MPEKLAGQSFNPVDSSKRVKLGFQEGQTWVPRGSNGFDIKLGSQSVKLIRTIRNPWTSS